MFEFEVKTALVMGSVRAASEVDGLLQILRLLATPPGAHHAPTLSFWMANSSELLHFLKSDRHITAFSLQVGHHCTRIGLDDKDTEIGLGNLQFLKTKAVFYSSLLTYKEKFVINTGATAPAL
jgi:hypothetical protein